MPPGAEHPDVACARLAAGSHGVITRAEALACGHNRSSIHRKIRLGLWKRLFPETYRIGDGRSDRHQRLAGLTKWTRGVASHTSAAMLLQLDGIGDEVLEVTTTRHLRPPGDSIKLHYAPRLPPDSGKIDGIPATSPTRTLLDLAGTIDVDLLELALEDSLRRGLTSLPRIRWCLATQGGQGRTGTRALRNLIDQYDSDQGVTESAFEVRLLQLLRSADLPLPDRQLEIRDGTRLLGRADFGYPDHKLAIEAVSFRWHSGRTAWSRDQRRWNALVAVGWRVINVTWEDLTLRSNEVVARVRQALGQASFFD
jgi:very-short-patch-repair endonuclease